MFLEVRKEEDAHCTSQSTQTLHYQNKKVNDMLNIKTYFLYKVKLLLGLYDYKFKIAIAEDKRSWQHIYMTRKNKVKVSLQEHGRNKLLFTKSRGRLLFKRGRMMRTYH
jgi:hypothetical protein